MKATDILESEHRVIEQVLACLEKMADSSEESKRLDCDAARDMIDFFRGFADRSHHAKEEQHLFVLLEALGMPRDGGPTGVMLAEHEMGRGLVGKMETAVVAFEHGNVAVLNDFLTAARSYIPLLREHIEKEDHCLFAMANENLSPEQQEKLLRAFHAEELTSSKDVGLDFYTQKAQALAERFQVQSQQVEAEAPVSCGHHDSKGCCGH